MDLRSASAGARWHPLTSLITFDSAASERELWLLPIWTPPRLDHTKSGYSTALHEATHQWSCKNTRLGWIAGVVAADAWLRWQDNRGGPIGLSARFERLLGALMPLLEGIALYAQLDYETDGDGEPFPSPLELEASLFEISFRTDHPLRTLLRLLREEEIAAPAWEAMRQDPIELPPTLPALLFLNGSDESTLHYFVGYLYVKTLQAWLARLTPLARDPAWFLPLAIKLLFDHPVIERAYREDLSPVEIVRAIHDSVVGISEEQWAGLGTLFADPQHRSLINLWDPYGQLAANRFDTLLEHDDEAAAERLLDDDISPRFEDVLVQVRASAAVHLLSWRTGELRVRSLETGELEVATADGDIASRVTRTSWFWSEYWEPAVRSIQEGNPNPFAMDVLRRLVDRGVADPVTRIVRGVGLALAHEHDFFARLAESDAKRVSLASFVGLSEGTPGVALWVDGEPAAWFAHGPDLFVYREEPPYDEVEYIAAGLALDPAERQTFAKALGDGTSIRPARAEGREFLTEQLIGSAETRGRLRRRFAGSPFTRARPELERWCLAHPFRQEPAAAPPSLVAAARDVFDFPGFAVADTPLQLDELLPAFPPAAA